ncbi:MAG: Strongly similar to 8-amino-7-oxononanoate synthase [uncultured bacterium]|nr:MAG: Strongly similar to 8-amino-7-oxononanoate synthase [uncultured bacterium]
MNISEQIEHLKLSNNYRKLKIIDKKEWPYIYINNRKLLNFGSNNYMGLADNISVKEAFIEGIEKWGAGAEASRLVSGTLKPHDDFEKALACFSKKEDALVFPSGYMANLGVITSFAEKDSLILIDKIDHASIIDGVKLSGAQFRVFPHRDYRYLEKILIKNNLKNKIVITDSIFSMDGDRADLIELVRLKKKYDFILVVDEAHGVGVFGENGCGLASLLGVINDVDIKVGTLSKAFGLQGGYVASTKINIDYLKNKSRSFIYTTGITPGICVAGMKVLELFSRMNEEREHLQNISRFCRDEFHKKGVSTFDSKSQIIPVVAGDNKKVLELEKKLFEKGFFAPAIRYPTVKKGTERIRISLSSDNTLEQVSDFVECFSGFIS